MNWEKPVLVEVNMSAEVGAYQEDSGERDEAPMAKLARSEGEVSAGE